MKKKFLAVLLSVIALAVLCTAVTACSDGGAVSFTVTFAGEGVDIPSQTVKEGGTVIEPNDPVLEGFTFEGWFVGDEKYDFTKPVSADLTLTAKWSENIDPYTVKGEGTKENPYILAHPNHLSIFSERVNSAEYDWYKSSFRLGADIDMSGVEYIPAGIAIDSSDGNSAISGFSGVFDGDGHTISNLTVSKIARSGQGYVGLFARTYMANITDVNLINVNLTVESYSSNSTVGAYIGGVAGYSSLTNFKKVTVTGSIATNMQSENPTYIGGIAGSLYNSVSGQGYITYTENCYTDITMSIMQGEDNNSSEDDGSLESGAVGGIFGYVINYGCAAAIVNCRTDGTVYGGMWTGGLAGSIDDYVSVIDCASGADVTATAAEVSYAGGLIGYCGGDSIIIDSFSTGKVKAATATNANYKSYAGGIVGYAAADEYYLGYTAGCAVSGSYYSGRITSLSGLKSSLGTSIDESAINDGFIIDTLRWNVSCWDVDGAYSKPATVAVSEVKTDFLITFFSKGSEVGSLPGNYTEQTGYALVGEPEALANVAPEIFWDWELSDGIAARFYMPVTKNITLTARWQDASSVASTYICTSVAGSAAYAVNMSRVGTVDLREDGTMQWIADSAIMGSWRYDGEHVILDVYSNVGLTSGTLVGGRLDFSVSYGTTGEVDYTFEPFNPSLYGEYISADGDILTFSGNNAVTFESSALSNGAYLRGEFEVSDRTVTMRGYGSSLNMSSFFTQMTATVNNDGSLTVTLTGETYSVSGVIFNKLNSVDYSGMPFVGSYSMSYVSAGYGLPTASTYTLIFGAAGDFIYRSDYSDTLGRYYYFPSSGIVKIVFDGNASSLTYDADKNIFYGMMNRGTVRPVVIAPSEDGKMRGFSIDGNETVVFVNEKNAYLIENGIFIPDVVIEGDFTDGSRVRVHGVEYYAHWRSDYEGYWLDEIGAEEGSYTYEGLSVILDGVGGTTGTKTGSYCVYDDTVVVIFDDDTFLAFDYSEAKAADGAVTALSNDGYQGVWYIDKSFTENNATVVCEKYYKLILDGYGHTTILYMADRENEVYRHNWSDWGEYTVTATGVYVRYNQYQEGDLVFYYEKNLVYCKDLGSMDEVTFYRSGYTGTLEIPSLPAELAGAYEGAQGEQTLAVNLRTDCTGTFTGIPFEGVYNGTDTVWFTVDSVQYKIIIADGSLTLVVGDEEIALVKKGAITEIIPAAIAGTWSGVFSGYGVVSGETRTVVLNTNGTGTYMGTDLSDIVYDARTNKITASFAGDMTVTMTWDENENTLLFVARDSENREWTATLTKQS